MKAKVSSAQGRYGFSEGHKRLVLFDHWTDWSNEARDKAERAASWKTAWFKPTSLRKSRNSMERSLSSPVEALGSVCLVASLLVVTLSKPGKPNVVPATA